MILGSLRSLIIEKHSPEEEAEGGFFEIEVKCDESLMQKSGDVKGHAYKTIGAALACAIQDTEVPVEYWTFEFDRRAVRRYGFPVETLKF